MNFFGDQNRNISVLMSMDLKGRLSCSPQEALTSGSSYNVPLLNALVLYVGMQVSQQFYFYFFNIYIKFFPVIALGFFTLVSMAFTVVAMIITRAKSWHRIDAFVHFVLYFSSPYGLFSWFPPRLISLSALKLAEMNGKKYYNRYWRCPSFCYIGSTSMERTGAPSPNFSFDSMGEGVLIKAQ